jgi:SAM-dependent methyltransferase
MNSLHLEGAIETRYRKRRLLLNPRCCAVTYDARWLEAIPTEVIERDYGCGNPPSGCAKEMWFSIWGRAAANLLYRRANRRRNRARDRIDMNDEMLARPQIPRRGGRGDWFHNVEFHEGHIQNLRPLVADDLIDVVLSNCVLNLVRPEDKGALFDEMFRVVKDGGRVAISDIVSNVEVPASLQNDANLWSGCISGAWQEDAFLQAFERRIPATSASPSETKRLGKSWKASNSAP